MTSIFSDTFRESTTMSSSSSSPSLSPPTRNSSHIRENLEVFSASKTRTQDVFQSIVKGRKSWKTLRGGEIVWPYELEAALIEGLEQYQPDDSRETRLLGRFPMRNRFISDYIFNKTGKRRTAKQVGSRLQQLRDTCGGKKLLNLLSPCRRQIRTSTSIPPELYGSPTYGPPSLRYDTESGSDASSSSSPTTPRDAHATLQSLLYRGIDDQRQAFTPQTVVFIDVLPLSCNEFEAQECQCAPIDELEWLNQGSRTVRISDRPRRFSEIDPTVTFLARSDTSAHSSFVVYRGNAVVFSEDTPLISVGPAPDHPEALLYSTTLIPNYWHNFAQCPDLTAYTIVQRVVQESQEEATPSLIFSAMYKFKYPSTVSESYPTSSFFQTSQHDFTRIEQPPPGQQLGYSYNLSCLLPLDADELSGVPSYVGRPPNVYDLDAFMKEADWDTLCSPMSPLSQRSGDEGDEDLLSPISVCFPEGANYPQAL